MSKKYNDPTVNTNVYLCVFNKDIDDNYLGLGKVGGACSSDRESHGVILGYDLNDIYSGLVNLSFDTHFSKLMSKLFLNTMPLFFV